MIYGKRRFIANMLFKWKISSQTIWTCARASRLRRRRLAASTQAQLGQFQFAGECARVRDSVARDSVARDALWRLGLALLSSPLSATLVAPLPRRLVTPSPLHWPVAARQFVNSDAILAQFANFRFSDVNPRGD